MIISRTHKHTHRHKRVHMYAAVREFQRIGIAYVCVCMCVQPHKHLDSLTLNNVCRFAGLKQDGVAGPKTMAAMLRPRMDAAGNPTATTQPQP